MGRSGRGGLAAELRAGWQRGRCVLGAGERQPGRAGSDQDCRLDAMAAPPPQGASSWPQDVPVAVATADRLPRQAPADV